jgi:hypothetical protein
MRGGLNQKKHNYPHSPPFEATAVFFLSIGRSQTFLANLQLLYTEYEKVASMETSLLCLLNQKSDSQGS